MTREHWTSTDLIDFLYGLRSDEEGHLATCAECRQRLQTYQQTRAAVEADWNAGDELASDLLAAQRRRIYQSIDATPRWWTVVVRPQWASAALVVALVAGGVTLVEQKYVGMATAPVPKVANAVSDSQLVDDVSSFAETSEPNAAAPLEGLFED